VAAGGKEQAMRLTNFYPAEEPDDAHISDGGFLGRSGSNHDGDGNGEAEREHIEEVAGDDAEVGDACIDPTHAVDRIFFSILAGMARSFLTAVFLVMPSPTKAVFLLGRGFTEAFLVGGPVHEPAIAAIGGDGVQGNVDGSVIGVASLHVVGALATQTLVALTRVTASAGDARKGGAG
jgi:hypothetical protein